MGAGVGFTSIRQEEGGDRGILKCKVKQNFPHYRWTDWAQKGTGRVSRSTLVGGMCGDRGLREEAECPGPGSWDWAVLGLEPGSIWIPKAMELCRWFII